MWLFVSPSFYVWVMFWVSVVLMPLISLSHHIGSLAIIISLEGAGGCPTGPHGGRLQGKQRVTEGEKDRERGLGKYKRGMRMNAMECGGKLDYVEMQIIPLFLSWCIFIYFYLWVFAEEVITYNSSYTITYFALSFISSRTRYLSEKTDHSCRNTSILI